ncbi:hypothetical protein I552_7435 [Mycobacterium xenopi 3993]|nr:hypothetical protein I552_7435 [Mycobacterium xenopi 3993]
MLRRRGGAAVRRHRSASRAGRRRRSWARSHGFDYEPENSELPKRWKRGVMSTVGDVRPTTSCWGRFAARPSTSSTSKRLPR